MLRKFLLLTGVTGYHRALQQRLLVRTVADRRGMMRIRRVSWAKTREKSGMMRQVFTNGTDCPLITANAASSTSASASWNRLEWRRVVLSVSTALAVSLMVATCKSNLLIAYVTTIDETRVNFRTYIDRLARDHVSRTCNSRRGTSSACRIRAPPRTFGMTSVHGCFRKHQPPDNVIK